VKAAILRAFKQPLEWQEISTPSPEPDEVLVQVMACGIDGTDLKLLDGFGYTPELPFVMGHEVAGVVTEAGYRVTGFEEGDRVIAYNFTTCGECLPCRTYREQICVNMGGVLGAKDRHGGYAEYVAIPGRQLVNVPEQVAWPDGAVCCDAGMTAFHAIDRARLRVGETVLIIGVGGVGSMAVQLAKAAGVRVLAVELSDSKREWARQLGADELLSPDNGDIPSAVRELTEGLGVDCVIDIVGQTETMGAGIDSLRHGGRLVIVGYTADHYPVEGKYLAQNEMEIIGTRAGRKQDLIEVSRLMASGKIRSIVTQTFPMENANEALAVLRSGENLGRIVLLTPTGRRAVDGL
jgi:2-desacetyl-2-hydroxyethyl bacteriochlorophyllide A dehydrogenase